LDVTWHGHACFRLRGRGATAVTDPYPASLGPRLPRLECDLVTVSHPHENHANVAAVSKEVVVIDGPGEYEVKGIGVTGIPAYHDAVGGAEFGRNTVFLLEIDDVRVCHLGDLGHKLDEEATERLGSVDVLLVPVGGGRTLSPELAAEVVRLVEPRYVVPMHFSIPGVKASLGGVDTFLKEMGLSQGEPLPRLSVQSSSSGEAETKVVVLDPRI
jgi:L-ascorbate metabolism protein UlaG (beta-lactamase superfamily)